MDEISMRRLVLVTMVFILIMPNCTTNRWPSPFDIYYCFAKWHAKCFIYLNNFQDTTKKLAYSGGSTR